MFLLMLDTLGPMILRTGPADGMLIHVYRAILQSEGLINPKKKVKLPGILFEVKARGVHNQPGACFLSVTHVRSA